MSANTLFPLKLQIARRFVEQALQGMSLDNTRGTIVDDQIVKKLMFIDVILTEDGDLIVEVALKHHLDRPGIVDLELKLASDWDLPEILQVTLSWSTHESSKSVGSDGIAVFPDITFDSLAEVANDPTLAGLDIALTSA